MRLDVKARAILRELVAEPRMPIGKIAGRVGLARGTCAKRVKEILRGHYLVLVPCRSKIKPRFQKYLFVKLEDTNSKVTAEFERLVLHCKTIMSCDYVESGRFDYILSVGVSSPEEYEQLLDRLSELPYWKRSETSSVITTVKVYQPSLKDLA